MTGLPPAVLLDRLRDETGRTMRLRSLVLAGAAVIGVLSSLGLYGLGRWTGWTVLAVGVPIVEVASVLLGLAAAEWALARVIGRRMAEGRPPPPSFWRVATLLELTVPTALMLLVARASPDPILAVTSPAPWIYFILILLSTLSLDPPTSAGAGMVAGLQYLAVSVYLVGTAPPAELGDPRLASMAFHGQKATILLLSGVVAAAVAWELKRRILRTLEAARERERIVDLFGQLTAPAVVDRLIAEGSEPLTERRHVAVLFLDLRGFSTYAEQAPPEAVVDYLNRLFDWSIETIHRYGGVVHQLLGDGFLAVFGAPVSRGTENADAVASALELVDGLEAFTSREGLPPTRIGIGLHAGEAVAGLVGSSIHKEYKVTGDVVNVAARIEQLCKEFDAALLCSEDVLRGVEREGLGAQALGPVPIRGREEPIRLVRLR